MKKNTSVFTLRSKAYQAFTLIELLVVIALIGILSTLVIANLNSARERSRDAQRKSDIRNIQTALRMYYNDTGTYMSPPFGNIWTVGTATYMNTVPNDPLVADGRTYSFSLDVANDTYTLTACFENKSDDKCDKVAGSIVACAGGISGCLYTAKP
jgi:general secretion pathway protein G